MGKKLSAVKWIGMGLLALNISCSEWTGQDTGDKDTTSTDPGNGNFIIGPGTGTGPGTNPGGGNNNNQLLPFGWDATVRVLPSQRGNCSDPVTKTAMLTRGGRHPQSDRCTVFIPLPDGRKLRFLYTNKEPYFVNGPNGTLLATSMNRGGFLTSPYTMGLNENICGASSDDIINIGFEKTER